MRRRDQPNEACTENAIGRRGQAGFSMLELIMVMALMAILTGIIGHSVGGEPEHAKDADPHRGG